MNLSTYFEFIMVSHKLVILLTRQPIAPIVDLLQAIPQIGLYKDVTKEEARVLIIKVKKIKPNENPTKTTQTKSCVIEFRQKRNSPIRKPTN
jgi:hypothetical protein